MNSKIIFLFFPLSQYLYKLVLIYKVLRKRFEIVFIPLLNIIKLIFSFI